MDGLDSSPSALLVLHQRPAGEVASLARQLEHLFIQAQLVARSKHSRAHPAVGQTAVQETGDCTVILLVCAPGHLESYQHTLGGNRSHV
jgi:hypothetical protein